MIAHTRSRLAKGGELLQELDRKGHFGESMAASVVAQILTALAFCHGKDVVHGGLKPANVLIDFKDQTTIHVSIIDFAISGCFDPEKALQPSLTPAYYAAPEVEEGVLGPECDIWSVGVIMYVLISGKPPFAGASVQEISKAKKKGVVTFPGIGLRPSGRGCMERCVHTRERHDSKHAIVAA
jgi:calcium-dependent protein kinase